MSESIKQKIAPPRIGRPTFTTICFWVLLVVGILAMFAAAGGAGGSAIATASFCLGFAGALGLRGLIISIGYVLEQRLIEMQISSAQGHQNVASEIKASTTE